MQELEHNENCPECPYTDLYPNCTEYLGKDALALIKELTEEIERLIDECGKQSVLWKQHFESIYETAKGIVKVDTVWKMQERIKEYVAELLKGRVEMISQYIRIINEGVDHIAEQISEGT